MINRGRIYSVKRVGSAEDLARDLTRHKWHLCTGLYHGGFLYLNDSPSAEGPQEYAIMRMDRFPEPGRHELDQVESVKFSLLTDQKALDLIRKLGTAEPFARVVVNIDGPGHLCPLCG